ncbi:hypothetical protein COL75_16645 [Bacillus wiedmannii]|uniref:YopX family protein n=1 Tax=Bacillus wiedmannii TaxID=1890302 RepID=UPI000BF7BACE|nr:YopX family protein [Bacillus wiedmannii]PFZ02339.1 hypothetical protein COL75_16645 [Bacillus wiedmannii]
MRETEFRGYAIEEYEGSNWFYGGICINHDDKLAYIDSPGNGLVPVKWESVGQYTGLKDVHDKKVYEGDVLDLSLDEKSVLRCEIVYQAPSFCRKWHDAKTIYLRQREIEPMAWNTHILYKVIGNAYENQELLK